MAETRSESEKIRDLERRLAAIEIEGSPNMRERVARMESIVEHLNDPVTGVYPAIHQSTDRLQRYAMALLTTFVVTLIVLIVHFISTGGF